MPGGEIFSMWLGLGAKGSGDTRDPGFIGQRSQRRQQKYQKYVERYGKEVADQRISREYDHFLADQFSLDGSPDTRFADSDKQFDLLDEAKAKEKADQEESARVEALSNSLQAQRERRGNNLGRKGTILTSPMGTEDSDYSKRRTILGS